MEEENDENLVKITDVCRACLTRTDNMKYILENSDEMFLLLSKFAFVANLELELGPKFPSYMCTICEEKIHTSYEFQQQCRKSNELVKEYLAVFEKQDRISVEPESEIILNTSEEANIVQILENATDTTEAQYEEIISSSTCQATGCNKVDYDENFQQDLSKCISDLKEKYSIDCVCVFCEFKADNSITLCSHVFEVHKESKNWCSLCNKVFPDIKAHKGEAHESDFVCKVCQFQCSTLNLIIDHLHSHQVSDKNSVEISEISLNANDGASDSQELLETLAEDHAACCILCNKMFPTNKALENHKCLISEEQQIGTATDKDRSIDTDASVEHFKDFNPKEVPLMNTALQRMRLQQYSVKDVQRAIRIVREKCYKHVTCIFCKFTAITNRSLSVHVTRVHGEYKGKWCSSCNQVIEPELTTHNKEVHIDDLKCPFCKKIKSNMGHFMEHLASHSAERLHKCDICHKSFISKRHLRIHRATHLKERPFKCEQCDKAFMQDKHLRAHLKAHLRNDDSRLGNEVEDDLSGKSDSAEETQEVPLKPHNFCKECDKKVRSLPSHNKKHHSKTNSVYNEKQNLCPHCGKRFGTRSKLTEHIRTHTGETPYICRYCDKRIRTRNILVVHERTHTGEKPYMCTVCGKSFAQSSVLNTHLRRHTGRPEQCTMCEKRFCRPAELRLHMRKHTGEKPYICDHCGQGFKQKSHLVEHTKTHTDDRPHKCEHCEKAFKSYGTLKSHLQIHTGQKPFKCSQCSYACRQPYSLTQHMAQHDIDKPRPDCPHTCQLCQKNYATMAHLTAHHSRFHPDLNPKLIETFQPPTNSEITISDPQIDPKSDQNDQGDYQVTEMETVETMDTMIIETQIDNGDIKFEPIHIHFTTLQDL